MSVEIIGYGSTDWYRKIVLETFENQIRDLTNEVTEIYKDVDFKQKAQNGKFDQMPLLRVKRIALDLAFAAQALSDMQVLR